MICTETLYPTLARAFGALRSSGSGALVADCPLCGGAGDLYVAIHASDKPTYLFNLCCFCDCDMQKVGARLLQLGAKRRRQRAQRK